MSRVLDKFLDSRLWLHFFFCTKDKLENLSGLIGDPGLKSRGRISRVLAHFDPCKQTSQKFLICDRDLSRGRINVASVGTVGPFVIYGRGRNNAFGVCIGREICHLTLATSATL